MSYEGYVRRLCKNGHLHSFDCYSDPDPETWECPDCGEKCVWTNCIDQTNGSFDEDGTRIDGYVELKETEESKAAICTCKECGNKHRSAPATYAIPAQ
jgi:hypothetical protein